MARVLDEKTMEYVGALAKLELTAEERKQAALDMGRMLSYIEQMERIDTTNIEPLSHLFAMENVFREDVPAYAQTNDELSWQAQEQALSNAPERRDNLFVVPNTLQQSQTM